MTVEVKICLLLPALYIFVSLDLCKIALVLLFWEVWGYVSRLIVAIHSKDINGFDFGNPFDIQSGTLLSLTSFHTCVSMCSTFEIVTK